MEILKGFVWDIQRFADPTGGYKISEFSNPTGTWDNTTNNKLVWTGNGYAWKSAAGTGETLVGTGTTTATALDGLTLDSARTEIIADAAWAAVAIKTGATTTTFKNIGSGESHSFSYAAANKAVTISGYDSTTGYTVSALDTGATVEKGTLTIAGTASTNGTTTVKSDATLAVTSGASVTSTSDTSTVTSVTTNLTLATGSFTTETVAQLTIGDGVSINGTTFAVTGTASKYTYGKSGSTVAIGAGDSIDTTNSTEKITATTATNSNEFTISADAKAKVTQGAPDKVENFTIGTIDLKNGGSKTVTFNYGDTAANQITFVDASAKVTGGTTSLTVDSFSAGCVTTAAGKGITIGTTTYTDAGGTGLTFGATTAGGTYGLADGKITATNATGSVNLMVTGGTGNTGATGAVYTQGDIVSVNSGTVYVESEAAASKSTGNAKVTGLDEVGEKVTIQDKTGKNGNVILEVVSENVVMVTGGQNNGRYYETSASAAFTDAGGTTELGAKDLDTTLYMTAGTTKFNSIGRSTTGTTDIAATLTVTGSGTNLTKKLVVTKKLSSVSMIGDTVTVEDGGTATKYNLSSSSSVTTDAKTTFTSTSGVVSNATGTLKLDGTNKELVALGTVNVDMTSAATGKLTYNAGAKIEEATITFGADQTLVLSEANDGANAVATVLDRNAKTLVGVDGNATITTTKLDGTNELASITTTGSGTFTINRKDYVVANDDNGVEFTMDTTTDDTISAVSGLAIDGTITTGKMSGESLTVNTKQYQSITAAAGVVFTATKTDDASITLLSKGDKVTDSTGKFVYEVTSMGSATDGIVIGSDNSLKGLNDGDTLTVTDNSGTSPVVTTYTAVNGMLKVENSAGTTMWTLSDSTDTGFEVANAVAATPDVTNGTKGESVTGGTYTFGNTSNQAAGVNSLVDGMYVTSDGKTSLSNTKAVAQVSLTDDVVTYTALSDKGQTVTVGTDTDDKQNWVINTRGGKDVITYNAGADATIESGAGADQVVSTSKGDRIITTGEGKDTIDAGGTGDVTINAGTGNDSIVARGSGDMLINLESGDNEVSHANGTNGNATIVGGAGKDTIEAAGLDDVVSGGDDADTFDVSAKSMTINDYAYGTDVLQAVTTSGAITVNPTNFGADGVVSIASGVVADVSKGTGTGEFYAVSLVDKDGKNKQNVAWAKEGGSNIDITTYDQAVTLIGDDDGKNALYAGTKADDIYSYADNDSVYGGAGKDSISLATGATGRVVGVATTSSKDTVSGFKASFEEGDSIFMVDGSASDVKASFANNTVTFKDGEGSLQLNNVTTSSTGAVELNVHGTKMALTGTNGVIATDSTSYANFYVGDNAAVSFATAEGEVNVDLRNGLDSGAEGAKFSGIIAVAGGAGQNTLIGGTAGETLTAGTGTSSLWGGAGKDTLVGNGASDAFFIGTGDGSDVVMNFSAAGNENADTLYALSDITSAKLTNNGVEVSVSDTDKLTLKNVTADTAIKFNSNGNAGVAKVGSATTANNFSYDSTVTYYGGGSKSDKIAFASGSTENAQIWLDGSQGKAYASIDVVDGANTSGNLLVAGDSSSQSIIGGKGDTSLWGGAGSVSDTLRSSSAGKTMFWWGAGEGNDLVVSASADDSVNLYNLKLSDVDAANSSITNSGVVLALNDGSKLTVQTSRDMTFSIDGQSWTAQRSSKEWKQNS